MDPDSAALLVAFIQFILSEEGQTMAVANMFSQLPTDLQTYNAATIASLTLPAGSPSYIVELASTTQIEVGAGPYVISGKRRSYAEYQRSQLVSDVAALATRVQANSAKTSRKVRSRFSAAGDVSDYGDEQKAQMAAVFAAEAGVPVSSVVLTVEAGSVNIVVDILVDDEASATATETKLKDGVLASSSALDAALTSGGVSGVTVASVEAPTVEEAETGSGNLIPLDTRDLALIGTGFGIVGFLLALIAFIIALMKPAGGRPVQREVSFPKADVPTSSTGGVQMQSEESKV